jgi:hypothetical protein
MRWIGVIKSKIIIRGFLAVVCGALMSNYVSPWLAPKWTDLGWRRPIQGWMVAHGMGSLAGKFGLLYLYIPDYTLAILVGIIIGLTAWRQWWQLSLVYSTTMVGFPYILDGFSYLMPFGGRVVSIVVLLNMLIMPLVLGGAWALSRGPCRRAARIASGLCLKCGYDLTGNISGICPECGLPTQEEEGSG